MNVTRRKRRVCVFASVELDRKSARHRAGKLRFDQLLRGNPVIDSQRVMLDGIAINA